ncbi:hypothetical protein J6590_055928 [Homalodisca vitripennis]|nr:hypothetical protein J6590_055928 [Homalodisca vitripennis]
MPRCTTKVCEVRSGIRVSLPLSKLGGFLECVTEKRDGTYKKSTCGTPSTRRDHDSPDKCDSDDTLSIYASDSDREEVDTSHAAEETKVNRSSPEISPKDASTKEPRTSKDEAVRPQHSEVEICVPDTNEASIQRVTVESSRGDLENRCLPLTPGFDMGDPLRRHLNHSKTESMIDRKRVGRPTSSTRSTSASNPTSCEESPARKKRKRPRSRSSSVTSSTSSTSSSSSSSSSSSIGSSTSSASTNSSERNKKKKRGSSPPTTSRVPRVVTQKVIREAPPASSLRRRCQHKTRPDSKQEGNKSPIIQESSYGQTPVSPAEPNNTTTGSGLKTDTTGQNISCAAGVRREVAYDCREPTTRTTTAAATTHDGRERQDGRRHYSESPPPPRKETDTTGQNISCAAGVRREVAYDYREPTTRTTAAAATTHDGRERQDGRRHYSESPPPPRKETDTTGQNISCAAGVRREVAYDYREPTTRTTAAAATTHDGRERHDGRRHYLKSPPPPRKETDTTGQNISCAARVRGEGAREYRESPATTVATWRRYSESHPPRKETDTTGQNISCAAGVRGDEFQQYPESQPRTYKRVRFSSQGILKNSHSSEPQEGYDEIRIRTLDSLLSTVSNVSSNRVLSIHALVEHDICYGFAAASSNFWCEGVGVPYDLERKRWVFDVDSRRSAAIRRYLRKRSHSKSYVNPKDIARFAALNTDSPQVVVCSPETDERILKEFCWTSRLSEYDLISTGGKEVCSHCFPRLKTADFITKDAGLESRLYCHYHAKTVSVDLLLYLPRIVSVNVNRHDIWLSTMTLPYEDWVNFARRSLTKYREMVGGYRTRVELLMRTASIEFGWDYCGDNTDPVEVVKAIHRIRETFSRTGVYSEPGKRGSSRSQSRRYTTSPSARLPRPRRHTPSPPPPRVRESTPSRMSQPVETTGQVPRAADVRREGAREHRRQSQLITTDNDKVGGATTRNHRSRHESIDVYVYQRLKDEDETRMRSKVTSHVTAAILDHVTAAILDHVTAGICPSLAGIFPLLAGIFPSTSHVTAARTAVLHRGYRHGRGLQCYREATSHVSAARTPVLQRLQTWTWTPVLFCNTGFHIHVCSLCNTVVLAAGT